MPLNRSRQYGLLPDETLEATVSDLTIDPGHLVFFSRGLSLAQQPDLLQKERLMAGVGPEPTLEHWIRWFDWPDIPGDRLPHDMTLYGRPAQAPQGPANLRLGAAEK